MKAKTVVEMKPNLEWAEIEPKHIKLELEHRRFQHLRHFVDQYYCYKNGFVNGNNRADWESIVWNDKVSVEARKLHDKTLAKGKPNNQVLKELRKKVVKEHVVPLKVITGFLEKLANQKDIRIEKIAEVLDKYTIFGTITKGEDEKLRKAGLTSKMPKEFEKGNELDGDVYARYKIKSVGIELECLGSE